MNYIIWACSMQSFPKIHQSFHYLKGPTLNILIWYDKNVEKLLQFFDNIQLLKSTKSFKQNVTFKECTGLFLTHFRAKLCECLIYIRDCSALMNWDITIDLQSY